LWKEREHGAKFPFRFMELGKHWEQQINISMCGEICEERWYFFGQTV